MSTEEEEKEQDRTYQLARSFKNDDLRSRAKFSEVRGLCRTCSYAFIRRRELSEVPVVVCTFAFERPHRIPLDIMECSQYQRVGEMNIRDMHNQAIILDSRRGSGQYL